MAVAQVGSCSSNQTPSLGTMGVALKDQKKKKKEKEKRNSTVIVIIIVFDEVLNARYLTDSTIMYIVL